MLISDLKNTYIKQPAEQIPIEISFGSLSVLPKGANEIVSTNVSAKKWKRTEPQNVENAPEILDVAGAAIVGPSKCRVRFQIKGGSDGYNYQVTLIATFDNGAKLEEEIHIRVVER